MSALHFGSATAIAAAIRRGDIGAREALEHFLARVDGHNGAVNAVVVQDRAGARARADAADRARRNGEDMGPLHGVPMTIKESYQLQGAPTTFGIPAMRDNIATSTALSVRRVAAGGANVFGKTNVPIRLADFQSFNEIYGVTNNPYDLTRTAGGSSGGSAAALAAGLSGVEMGSDIGGSIRNPAHYCGVFGHKPTFGLCPMRGHALDDAMAASDISVIGPLARSAGDLAVMVDLMAGPDEIDAPGLCVSLPALTQGVSGLRIAVWDSDPLCPTSAAVKARLQAVCAALSRAGAHVDETARPDFSAEHSHEVFSGLLWSAMAARLPEDVFAKRLEAAARSGANQSASGRIALAETMRLHTWARLNEARVKLRWAWRRFFDTADFLITPIMPTTAFRHAHGPEGARRITIDGEDHPYFSQTFWAGLAGVAFLPATVFPAGLAPDGLPVGLQIIGPAYGDLRTIALAARLEAMGFGFVPPPAFA